MISSLEHFQPASAEAQDNGMGESQQKALVRSAEACALPVVSSLLVVPHGTNALVVAQPIACVKSYLTHRAPVPCWELERPLFDKLPLMLRSEVRRMQSAVDFVRRLTTAKPPVKVQPACVRALTIYREFNPLKTFRGKYDLWIKLQDWLVLVNRAKAGSAWQASQRGLSDTFLDYVAARCGEFRRGDAMEQAIISIHRQWQTGKNHRGEFEPVAGYELNWEQRTRAILPEGWHSTNIRRQMEKRAKFAKAVKAILHESNAAAKKFLPQTHSTRRDLRFMELIQFDDVRCDFRVMDTDSGQVNDLWLLIARDVATGMLLGFGMRPARARDDGSQEHLKLQDMKQLCGWLLETYGLPPYLMTWVLENGTATLAEAVRDALREMVGADRIDFQMASMLGGKSSLGYWEKAVGNSKAKAMLESLNRLQHMMTSHFPGQIGLNYSKLPAEYREREREAIAIWEAHRPEDRAELKYPFYTIPQARTGLFEIFALQNRRTEHDMEGFEKIAEWFDGVNWQPAHNAPADMTNVRTRTRMQSPIERAAMLCTGVEPFTKISAEILTVFYEHTQRTVTVTDKGEIQITVEGKVLRFAPPSAEFALLAKAKCLAYFNPDDPRFLTLTDGRGSILGTWLRRGLVAHDDRDALTAALKHSANALAAAKDRAAVLADGQRAELEEMRAHNSNFITVVKPKADACAEALYSPVATRVRAVAGEKKQTEKKSQARRDANDIAREALRNIAV